VKRVIILEGRANMIVFSPNDKVAVVSKVFLENFWSTFKIKQLNSRNELGWLPDKIFLKD